MSRSSARSITWSFSSRSSALSASSSILAHLGQATAMTSAPVAAASLAAVELLEAEPEMVEKLKRAAGYFRDSLVKEGLDVEPGEIPIVPVLVGDEKTALEFASRLLEEGVYCTAIRPPSVPAGTGRLRITVMATHEKQQLDYVVEKVSKTARNLGILSR